MAWADAAMAPAPAPELAPEAPPAATPAEPPATATEALPAPAWWPAPAQAAEDANGGGVAGAQPPTEAAPSPWQRVQEAINVTLTAQTRWV